MFETKDQFLLLYGQLDDLYLDLCLFDFFLAFRFVLVWFGLFYWNTFISPLGMILCSIRTDSVEPASEEVGVASEAVIVEPAFEEVAAAFEAVSCSI
jgi:hypothetical protein